MNASIVILFLIIGVTAFGLSTNDVSAEISGNNAFILEGSGFAVTEDSIKSTEIDFAISTGDKVGTRTNILVEDGFVTLNEEDFIIIDSSGTALRDGKFIRISGTAEDSFGDEVAVRIFGRLIQDSEEGSVYGFTGRLTHEGETHKIIYTTKLSRITSTSLTKQSVSVEESDENVITILRGSSKVGLASDYIEALEIRQEIIKTRGSANVILSYFFPNRLSIEPGTSITIVNDDVVEHTIVSGTGLGTNSRASQGKFVYCDTPQPELPEGFSSLAENKIADSNQSPSSNLLYNVACTFSFDGRIHTGILQPGESWTASFDDPGFYRLIDPDYPWMNIVVYSFPETDSEVIRSVGYKQKGN